MGSSVRRWPPIVAAVAGALLVFLVLPNPLSVPQQNPSASAEYAPVPGKQDSADAANFSETGEATSPGIGSGGDDFGPLPGRRQKPQPIYKAGDKECVGNPPRQTEDPLSPPCVAVFNGKNGGATFKGVTKDDIVVVIYNDRCCHGDLNAPWKPSDEDSCNSQYEWECDGIVRTVKAFHRYFEERFQTYGRTVRLYAQESSGELGGSCASRQADALQAVRQWKPFAAISFAQGGVNCYIGTMAKNNVPVFGLNEDAEQHIYDDFRPYAYGFWPTQEVQVEWSAAFICDKLAGRTAKYANDPTYHDDVRSFGFIKPDGDSRGTELRLQSDLLLVELKQQCGFEFDMVEPFTASGEAAGSREANTIMSKFKQNEITTVVCYCVPRMTELTAPTMLKAATGTSYFPEWYWDDASQMTRALWHREYGANEHVHFGPSYLWRAPAFRSQFHYQAFKAMEPQAEPSVYWSVRIYYLFMNLYSGIQAAGADLTPQEVEKGMFTFRYTDGDNPMVPMGGYGPYGPDAVSNYTFVDTAMAVWWDPTGIQPGAAAPEGCMRVAEQGLRHYADQWPKGDRDLFKPGSPCTADLYKIADSNRQ